MGNYLVIHQKKGIFEKSKEFFKKIFFIQKRSSKSTNKKQDILLIYKQIVDEKSIDINNIDTETLKVIETLLGEEINIINNKIMLDRMESEIIKRELENFTGDSQENLKEGFKCKVNNYEGRE